MNKVESGMDIMERSVETCDFLEENEYLQIDFGSWGGGYSDNLGVRDYWSQTTESGGNWYDGVYGYKSGWSVPIVQSLGIEGHQGSQARHSRMLSSA